jgi:hypothetical protein
MVPVPALPRNPADHHGDVSSRYYLQEPVRPLPGETDLALRRQETACVPLQVRVAGNQGGKEDLLQRRPVVDGGVIREPTALQPVLLEETFSRGDPTQLKLRSRSPSEDDQKLLATHGIVCSMPGAPDRQPGAGASAGAAGAATPAAGFVSRKLRTTRANVSSSRAK